MKSLQDRWGDAAARVGRRGRPIVVLAAAAGAAYPVANFLFAYQGGRGPALAGGMAALGAGLGLLLGAFFGLAALVGAVLGASAAAHYGSLGAVRLASACTAAAAVLFCWSLLVLLPAALGPNPLTVVDAIAVATTTVLTFLFFALLSSSGSRRRRP